MAKLTGGPAFPRPYSQHDDRSHNLDVIDAQEGMTLRDYFAGQALCAMVAGEGARQVADRDGRYDGETNWKQVVAANAYEFADAMLAAREAV